MKICFSLNFLVFSVCVCVKGLKLKKKKEKSRDKFLETLIIKQTIHRANNRGKVHFIRQLHHNPK